MPQPIFETVNEVPQDAKYSMWSILDSLKKVVEKVITLFEMNATSWTLPLLLNSWVNTGDPYQGASYRKDFGELVYLSGVVAGGTPGVTSVVFELAVGYRPPCTLRFPVATDDAGDPGHVEINKNGEVIIEDGSTTQTSLDGIIFRAE